MGQEGYQGRSPWLVRGGVGGASHGLYFVFNALHQPDLVCYLPVIMLLFKRYFDTLALRLGRPQNMAVLSPSRPDLLAYREATTLEFSKLVTELTAILGKKLTAYIASVKDARAIERWMAGSEPYKGVEERLRLAYRLAKMISDHEGPRVVQAWFTGLNPELSDRVPVRLLRDEDVEAVGPEILGAARAFLAGG